MTIINGSALLRAAPLSPMVATKERVGGPKGVSHGLAEAGYDLRIKQTVTFTPPDPIRFFDLMSSGAGYRRGGQMALEAFHGFTEVIGPEVTKRRIGRCALASSVERFQMPNNLVGVMGHKSTRARGFTCAWAGTTAEPGWSGHLTIELTFHGNEPVTIHAGTGVMQVLFHELAEPADYGNGKYQGQADRPVAAILEG